MGRKYQATQKKLQVLNNTIVKFSNTAINDPEHETVRLALLELCDKEHRLMLQVLSKHDELPDTISQFVLMLQPQAVTVKPVAAEESVVSTKIEKDEIPTRQSWFGTLINVVTFNWWGEEVTNANTADTHTTKIENDAWDVSEATQNVLRLVESDLIGRSEGQ